MLKAGAAAVALRALARQENGTAAAKAMVVKKRKRDSCFYREIPASWPR
jgi:hypothetical protein